MLTSILRTIVPYVWGIVIGAVLSAVPLLEPLRADLLAYGDAAVPVIAALLAGLWYALWRWLEPKLPDWLTRILLGSAKAPVYEPTVRVGIDQESIDEQIGSIQRARDDLAAYPIPEPHEPTASPDRTE